jgi:hypothetical protein
MVSCACKSASQVLGPNGAWPKQPHNDSASIIDAFHLAGCMCSCAFQVAALGLIAAGGPLPLAHRVVLTWQMALFMAAQSHVTCVIQFQAANSSRTRLRQFKGVIITSCLAHTASEMSPPIMALACGKVGSSGACSAACHKGRTLATLNASLSERLFLDA